MGLDISRISTYHDSNIIGLRRNALLPDEGINKVSNPDIDMVFLNNIDITQCDKYLSNDTLNININTQVLTFHVNSMIQPQY